MGTWPDSAVGIDIGGDTDSLAFNDITRDPASQGGTLTFQMIGSTGWPSRRDPASGNCDALDRGTCCMARREIQSDQLTPWDDELIMTLRGPFKVRQLVAYQPSAHDEWLRTGVWDSRAPAGGAGLAFTGDTAATFDGVVGNTCLI